MSAQIVQEILLRDLNRLKAEILAYQHEQAIWRIEKGIANSAGNLCLHLVGNLNTYIGAVLGKSGYVRDRDLEFSAKDVPRKELVKMIGDTINVIRTVLEGITPEQLDAEFPVVVFETKTSAGFMLVHLAAHLNYHLGQVNYHRRLLDAA